MCSIKFDQSMCSGWNILQQLCSQHTFTICAKYVHCFLKMGFTLCDNCALKIPLLDSVAVLRCRSLRRFFVKFLSIFSFCGTFCGTFYVIILWCRKNAAESNKVSYLRRFWGTYKSKKLWKHKKSVFLCLPFVGAKQASPVSLSRAAKDGQFLQFN